VINLKVQKLIPHITCFLLLTVLFSRLTPMRLYLSDKALPQSAQGPGFNLKQGRKERKKGKRKANMN
jgi:hypothetical protein